jgi:MFS family permease
MNTAVSTSPPLQAVSASWLSHYGLALLFLANFLNFADGALFGIVVEPVRKDLGLSDTQISIVSGIAFIGFNMLAGVFLSRWVDRGNRKFILAGGITLWSAATWATSFADSFGTLALCRMMVGIGEATVFPVALSLLADYYAKASLPRSVSIFQASSGLGLVAGSVLAGVLAAAYGWRNMFAICGAAGIVLILVIVFTLPEPKRGQQDKGGAPAGPTLGLGAALAKLVRMPGFVWLALGYGASNMALAVLPSWGPAFLLRTHDVPLAQVGAVIGPAAGLGGLTGTILAGLLATRLIRKSGNPLAGLRVPIVALLFAAPALAVFLFAPTLPVLMVGVAVMNFCLSSALGPCLALAVSSVSSDMRGLTTTVMLITLHLLGVAIAPLIVGMVSDGLKPNLGDESLRYALSIMIAAPIVASFLLTMASRRLRPATSSPATEAVASH